jgi:hypothetical protein
VEIKKEMKNFKIAYECDVDGCTGEMTRTGVVPGSDPKRWLHVCSVCNETMVSEEMYPRYHSEETIVEDGE